MTFLGTPAPRRAPDAESAGPRPGARWIAAAVLALLAPVLEARQQPKSSCEACHLDVARAEADHAHARAGIACTACHGGDSTKTTKEEAKATGTGYRGVPKGTELVTMCGTCHADVETMNPYGLPTDQLAQYRSSRHGQGLFEKGDPNVATCASCHGAHGILGPGSSDSPVHPTNVPATCGKCHGDAKLMGTYGIDADIPKAWHASIHATMLLEKGDISAPTCATCHGSHGAVPPGFRSVEAVCGKCHVREKELFGQSPHASSVEGGDFAGCEVCHSNHDVRPATTEILDRMCALCHMGETEPLARRDRIAAALRSTETELASTRDSLQAASAQGLVTEDDQLLLDEAVTAFKGARVVQHAIDVDRLEEATGEARANLERVSKRIASEREEKRLKRLLVLPVVAFLALMSLGFLVRQRRIERHTGERSRGRTRS